MSEPLSNAEIERLSQALFLRTRPDPDLLERLLDEHAVLRRDNERWGERIKLLERRARFAELVLSGHGDYLLPNTKETP